MTQQELTLAALGVALSQLARPHGCDESLSPRVLAALRQLGISYDEPATRQALIAEVWARKRNLAPGFQASGAQYDGPPSAA